jgi:putative SOS response-associated peptidase YedK
MCGRYYRKSDKHKIADAFHMKHVGDFPLPSWDYNVAPSTMQPVIRANRDTGERELVKLRWGLVPFSTKSLADLKGKSTINARAETITRGWWAQPLKKRRCPVPASGFYEWTHDKEKKPFACDLSNGHMMALLACGTPGKIRPMDSDPCLSAISLSNFPPARPTQTYLLTSLHSSGRVRSYRARFSDQTTRLNVFDEAPRLDEST